MPDQMNAADQSQPGQMADKGMPGKPMGEPLAEITLCLYPGGKLALRIDDGQKVAVGNIETALAAIRRFAEEEAKGGMERGEEMKGEPQAEETAEEAFSSGYAG